MQEERCGGDSGCFNFLKGCGCDSEILFFIIIILLILTNCGSGSKKGFCR